jgi:hypothetical protein
MYTTGFVGSIADSESQSCKFWELIFSRLKAVIATSTCPNKILAEHNIWGYNERRQSHLTLPFYCVINTCIARLYEQGADINRIGQYVMKWVQWVKAALQSHLYTHFQSNSLIMCTLHCYPLRHIK